MAKVQKTSTQEFKREAVRLAQTSGKPIAQVARELGISDTSIHQWRKELAEHGQEAFPGSGHQTAQEEERRRLKRELERTQKERDILKKPAPQYYKPTHTSGLPALPTLATVGIERNCAAQWRPSRRT